VKPRDCRDEGTFVQGNDLGVAGGSQGIVEESEKLALAGMGNATGEVEMLKTMENNHGVVILGDGEEGEGPELFFDEFGPVLNIQARVCLKDGLEILQSPLCSRDKVAAAAELEACFGKWAIRRKTREGWNGWVLVGGSPVGAKRRERVLEALDARVGTRCARGHGGGLGQGGIKGKTRIRGAGACPMAGGTRKGDVVGGESFVVGGRRIVEIAVGIVREGEGRHGRYVVNVFRFCLKMFFTISMV